jgi:SAM-dependent methyltransferase
LRLANDVFAGGHNPTGQKDAATFAFPYANDTFDLAILCSLLTHILPDAIENYLRQTTRVLARGGSAFISVFLFDPTAVLAMNDGTTIFDFRHQIGPCLTFDAEHPEEGIACEEAWFLQEIGCAGLHVTGIYRGNWREVRSYAIRQDYVVAAKP